MALAQPAGRTVQRYPRIPTIQLIDVVAAAILVAVLALGYLAVTMTASSAVTPDVLASGQQWESERRSWLGEAELGPSGDDWEEQRRQQGGERPF